MSWPDLTDAAPVWVLYGVVVAAGLLMSVAFWTGRRRPSAAQPTSAAPTSTTRGDVLAAVIATAVSAEGMWETFSALDMPIPLRALTFAFLELNVIQSGRRARRTMLKKLAEILEKGTSGFERPTAGADGVAMWVLTCISALLSVAYELTVAHPNAAVVLVRLAAPLVAAWAWERSMALERRLQGWSSGVTSRFTWDRIAVRLGLAEPRERTVTEVDTDRRLLRLATATARLEGLERHRWHLWGALRRGQDRKGRAMQEAMEHTDLATSTDTQARLLAMTAALSEARNFRAVSFPFWVPQPAADPRPRVCSGKQAAPGCVALRIREPGKGMRVLHPAEAQPDAEARTDGVQRTEETRTSNRLLRVLQLRREAEQAMREAVRGVQGESVRARTGGPRTGMGPVRTGAEPPAAEPKATVIPLPPGASDYEYAEPKPLVQPRQDHTGEREEARTEEPPAEPVQHRTGKPRTVAAPSRTARTGEVTMDVRKPRPYWVQVLAEEIRTARTEGRTWEPDYDDLEARTGWKRSWCEKTVRAARTAAEEPSATRTGTDNA